MCRFSGLKVFSEENLVKYRARNFETCKILKVHVEKIAKTKNKLWLRVTQLESQPQISDHKKRKNAKQIAAASYATPKQRAALSHKDTRDSSNLMPWAPGSGRNARRSADVMRIAPIDQLVYG